MGADIKWNLHKFLINHKVGYLWLLSQIILAIKLRTNSRYRNDIEKTNELRLIRDPSSVSTKRVSIVNTFQMIDRLSSLITIPSITP
jgi:hypothetical protein